MYYFTMLFLTLFSILGCSNISQIETSSKIIYTSPVKSNLLKTLDFKGKELVAVPIRKHWYYVHKSGKKIRTLTYDNGPDKFKDGLARTRYRGKIGFFNRNLEMILKPVYDFAFPFYKGKAEICTGCKELQEGEQSMLDGGEWKKIDREGLIIE